MSKSQKYILDSNDTLLSELITGANKSNLISGGLFKDITMTDASDVDSGNFTARNLINSSDSVTLNWESRTLSGDWDITGDLTLSGDLNLTPEALSNLLGSGGLDTDMIDEGATNLYYTEDRVSSKVSSMLEYDNAVHVSPSGTDSRDGLENYDLSNPFQTIRAAKAEAVSGDTIVVWPGTYNDEYDILKNGVDYHFLPGSKVVQTTNLSNGTVLFRDPTYGDGEVAGDRISNVYGSGSFVCNNTLSKSLIRIADPSSKVRIQGDLINSTTTTNVDPIVLHNSGSLELKVRKITSTGGGVRSADGILILKDSYVKAELGSAVATMGTSLAAFLDNCQLETECEDIECGAVYIYPGSSGCRIKNSILFSASTYSITTQLGGNCVVSILAGNTANKPIMQDPAVGQVVTEELAPFTVDTAFALTIF